MQVAVDGPAGSGKSSVCRIVAKSNNLIYLDTGAMYRAVTYISLTYGRDNLIDKISETEFIFTKNGTKLELKINNELVDVTDIIRSKEITRDVSEISSDKGVRDILTAKQQELAKNRDIIMEGRDITTVVLPNADIKVFLTASASERANRRYLEIKSKTDQSYEDILNDIIRRDNIDSTRSIAPLMISPDADTIDTTSLTLDGVAEKISDLIKLNRN